VRDRLAWLPYLTLAVVGLLPLRVEAQPPPAAAEYPFEMSTVPMTRNAALVESALRLTEGGVDWSADRLTGNLFVRKSTAGFLARLGRGMLFDYFLEHFGVAAAHEYGHATRGKEWGRELDVHLRWFGGSYATLSGGPLGAAERMSVFGGGFEGAYALTDRVGRRIHARGTATPGELMLLLVTALHTQAYYSVSLSERRLSDPDLFLDRGRTALGDPAQYTVGLTGERLSQAIFLDDGVQRSFADIQTTGRSIRRRSALNLLDYDLVTTAMGVAVDHMWRGKRQIPVRWLAVGPLSLSPGMSYRLSPVGPELQIRTRYTQGNSVGRVYARWTERAKPGDARLVGAGGELQRIGAARFTPNVAFDVWRNPNRTMAVRVEAGATIGRTADDRLRFSLTVGAKTRGYLGGYPLKPGGYAGVGGQVRF
jgi:hypothetical protein